MEVRNQRALVSGALFFIIAVIYLVIGWEYNPGTAARMGPGYFPRMLGFLLAGLGVLIMLGAVRPSAEREKLERWNLKPLLLIAASIAIFAYLLPRMGLIIALAAMLTIAGFASREFTWRGSIISTIVLILMAVAAFHYGIGLQMPILPRWH